VTVGFTSSALLPVPIAADSSSNTPAGGVGGQVSFELFASVVSAVVALAIVAVVLARCLRCKDRPTVPSPESYSLEAMPKQSVAPVPETVSGQAEYQREWRMSHQTNPDLFADSDG
jgi:hypothetical protein